MSGEMEGLNGAGRGGAGRGGAGRGGDSIQGHPMEDQKKLSVDEFWITHGFLGKYKKVAKWVESSHGHYPDGAVEGGMTSSGEKLYVARAEHNGDVLPGKLHPSHSVCYVAHNGKEHGKNIYQVLVNPARSNLGWVAASRGSVPAGTLQGGRTARGEALFIGRCKHAGDLVCGKVHPSHGVCYIPYAGGEHGSQNYEVLVVKTVDLK
ncbi:unnamed protein product [Darwinula stevensoni]|uniref:Uncharacterized protein n=1 Tax=Darwinula stevensoni TaxID=69355 RepID=A0A7R8XB66_9CRUS|nr:unnamed protein product [Darwinula stevensoni]CAG0886305.1 unnamed protein product [Darwinula stevensoni]